MRNASPETSRLRKFIINVNGIVIARYLSERLDVRVGNFFVISALSPTLNLIVRPQLEI